MCTVTFVPKNQGYILTHNRDEMSSRTPSLDPDYYTFKNQRILFPKDPEGKGTWIALNENGDWACILNGAFERYGDIRNKQKSRGLLVLEALAIDFSDFKCLDFQGYLPFTIILFKENFLYDIRWEGDFLAIENKDILKPHIWSSVNLYPENIRRIREEWFDELLGQKSIDEQRVWNFHNSENNKIEARYQMKMKIPGKQETVSVTQISKQNNDIQYIHRNFASRNQLKIRPNFLNVRI
jgi:hypothetical protein